MTKRIAELARRHGLELRSSVSEDFAGVRQLAIARFGPWLLKSPENLNYYEPNFDRYSLFGVMHMAVAERAADRALCGYIYVQIRDDGDVYIRELAARKNTEPERMKFAGSLLLGWALEAGLERRGPGLATANVMAGTDAAGFYRRFGWEERDARSGYTANGAPNDPQDLWMAAEIDTAYSKILRYVSLAQTEVQPRDQEPWTSMSLATSSSVK